MQCRPVSHILSVLIGKTHPQIGMYELHFVSLIYKNESTKSFPTTVGLKQRDILGTIFFFIYI